MYHALKTFQTNIVLAIVFNLIFLFFNTALAQNFNLTLGGEGTESIEQIIELDNGDLVAIGTTSSLNPANAMPQNNGEQDIWFIRLDSVGNIIANKLIGGEDEDKVVKMFYNNIENELLLVGSTRSKLNYESPYRVYNDKLWTPLLDTDGNIVQLNFYRDVLADDFIDVIMSTNEVFIAAKWYEPELDHAHLYEVNAKGELSWRYGLRFGINFILNDADFVNNTFWIVGTGANDYVNLSDQTEILARLVNDNSPVLERNDFEIGSLKKVKGFSNGNAIITGIKNNVQPFMLKVDSMLNTIWEKEYELLVLGNPSSIILLDDETLLFAGSSNSDISLIKMDVDGNIIYNNTFGGDSIELFEGILQTNDSGFMIWATSESSNSGNVAQINNGKKDTWVVKLDAEANIEWQHLLGGNENDEIKSITQLTNGGYVLCGHTYSSNSGDILAENQGERDAWILKLDKDGNFDEKEECIPPNAGTIECDE